MNRRLMKFSLLTAIVVLSAMVVFTGCSNNSPLGPEPDFEGQLLGKSTIRSLDYGALTTTTSTKQMISARNGGVIDIDRNIYLHEFIIDEGGLDENTEISVASYNDQIFLKNAIVFEFGPDGLVFNKASKLDFEMAELNPNAAEAKLYYYDPGSGGWLLQDSKSVVNGHVEFDIYHFSKYAISE